MSEKNDLNPESESNSNIKLDKKTSGFLELLLNNPVSKKIIFPGIIKHAPSLFAAITENNSFAAFSIKGKLYLAIHKGDAFEFSSCFPAHIADNMTVLDEKTIHEYLTESLTKTKK